MRAFSWWLLLLYCYLLRKVKQAAHIRRKPQDIHLHRSSPIPLRSLAALEFVALLAISERPLIETAVPATTRPKPCAANSLALICAYVVCALYRAMHFL